MPMKLTPQTSRYKPVPDAGWRELLLWLARRRSRLRVSGDSMRPTLAPGDVVLIDPRAYQGGRLPQPDDVVVTLHPHQPELPIIKRMAVLEEGDLCLLLSDNPAVGSDSRHFGTVPVQALHGRVTSRIRPE